MARKSLLDYDHLYFVTTSLTDRRCRFLHLQPYAHVILNSIRFQIDQERISLYAFVIMPNHFHLLYRLHVPHTVSTVMHSIKSYSSKTILKQLLHYNLNLHARYKHHLWKHRSHERNIYSQRFLTQKLEYIHNNPIAKHWRLAEERHLYPYCSASYYDMGWEPAIPLADASVLLG